MFTEKENFSTTSYLVRLDTEQNVRKIIHLRIIFRKQNCYYHCFVQKLADKFLALHPGHPSGYIITHVR